MERVVAASDGATVSRDVRYFVSSLDPDRVSPQDLLGYVRGHWHIENGLHFVKDRWWDEDRHWVRRPGLPARLALLTTAALTALRLLFPGNLPLRRQADRLCWKPHLALAAICPH